MNYKTEQFDLRCCDNMELMKEFEDNHFDLAIVDPPYGINMDGGKIGGDNNAAATNYTKKNRDIESPNFEYFNELIRVSRNQIIWGANHFISKIPYDSPSWIVWNKDNTGNFADCELAYTSHDKSAKMFTWRWNGMIQQNMKEKQKRIHPTEKPHALYSWIIMNYCNSGFNILDTHLGSMSIALAVDKINKIEKMNIHLTGCDIDEEYFQNGIKRLKIQESKLSLF